MWKRVLLRKPPSWKARRDRGGSRRVVSFRWKQLGSRNWPASGADVPVGDIVTFDVLGAAPRGSGATEAAAREDVRRVAENLRAPHEDFNGDAFLIVRG